MLLDAQESVCAAHHRRATATMHPFTPSKVHRSMKACAKIILVAKQQQGIPSRRSSSSRKDNQESLHTERAQRRHTNSALKVIPKELLNWKKRSQKLTSVPEPPEVCKSDQTLSKRHPRSLCSARMIVRNVMAPPHEIIADDASHLHAC